MIRWELYKLLWQWRPFFGLGATALLPVLFVAAGEITHRRPDVGEALFAAHLLQNGLVVPLITLSFSTFVLLPLVIASVTGYAIAGKSQPIP